jgi:uncharacterized membrane protein
MNAAQLHLLFCHFPIVGLAFAGLVNLYAFIKKNPDLQKLSLWIYVILGIFSFVAWFTGDDAGKIIQTYPGITEDVIESHENIALFFFIGLMITTAIALAGLLITKTKEQLLKKFTLVLFIAAILMGVLAGMTGSTGGAIRHTEIKQGVYLKAR